MPHHNTSFNIDFGSWQHNTPRADPPWRSWCKSPIWKSIRRHRLAEEPLCRQCAIEGRTVAASHVDHVDPHRGQLLLFFKYEKYPEPMRSTPQHAQTTSEARNWLRPFVNSRARSLAAERTDYFGAERRRSRRKFCEGAGKGTAEVAGPQYCHY